MSFCDRFILSVTEATARTHIEFTSPVHRQIIQELRLSAAHGAITIAAGPNPFANLLDMTTMVTLQRIALQDRSAINPELIHLLRAFQRGETEIWAIADRTLTPAQHDELIALIESWRAENPDRFLMTLVRFEDFADVRRRSPTSVSSSTSLLGLFALDPLANLDPATREVEQTRLLAERAFFFLQRLSTLVAWEMEGVFSRVVAREEVVALQEKMDSIAQSADRATRVAESIPDLIREERAAAVDQMGDRLEAVRTAAIDQLMDRVAQERERTFADLAEGDERLRASLTELRDTLAAGETLSSSAQDAIASLEILLANIHERTLAAAAARAAATGAPGSPGAPGAPGEGPAQHPDHVPFNINEYGAAAIELAQAMREAQALTDSLNTVMASPAWSARLAEINQSAQGAERAAHRWLNAAFIRAAALVLILLAGLFALRLFGRSTSKG